MKKDWVNIGFLTLTPVIGIAGTAAYTWYAGFALWMPLLMVGMYLAVGLSICAGYHRFFSHKSYEAHPIVQSFFAFFGAMAAQNSILWWSSAHRVHHKYADKDWDPYNIRRGFWWAHILWIFYRNDQRDDTFENSPDLLANKIDEQAKLVQIHVSLLEPALSKCNTSPAVIGVCASNEYA
jgi:stearoyl-CoA desaturase (delta-9 desaturase)